MNSRICVGCNEIVTKEQDQIEYEGDLWHIPCFYPPELDHPDGKPGRPSVFRGWKLIDIIDLREEGKTYREIKDIIEDRYGGDHPRASYYYAYRSVRSVYEETEETPAELD